VPVGAVWCRHVPVGAGLGRSVPVPVPVTVPVPVPVTVPVLVPAPGVGNGAGRCRSVPRSLKDRKKRCKKKKQFILEKLTLWFLLSGNLFLYFFNFFLKFINLI
jgi:hypothetical protein